MNTIFDIINSSSTGYNNPTVREGVLSHANTALLSSRPAMGMMPPAHYVRQLQETLLSVKQFESVYFNFFLILYKVAPQGLKRVQPMMCGTCSNENAMKAAFIAYMVISLISKHLLSAYFFLFLQTRLRGGTPAMDSELVHSALLNKVHKIHDKISNNSDFGNIPQLVFKLSVKCFLAGLHSWTCLLPRHTTSCLA